MNGLQEKRLPDGWSSARLRDVVDVLDRLRVPVNSDERSRRVGPVPYYGATGQVGWINDYLFDEELILLGEDGAPFLEARKAKAYMIRGKSWVNNHAHVLRGRLGLDSKFLMHQLNHVDYRPFVSGTTRLKLPQTSMSAIPLVIAPEGEQKRLVAEIEKQFTRLDVAVSAIKRIQANLKRCRASVLKTACEGRLVPTEADLARAEGRACEPADQLLVRILKERRAKWEAGQLANMKAAGKVPKDDNWKRKYSPPSTPDAPTNLDLPSGWVWTGFEQIAEGHQHAIKAGPFGSALKKSYYVPMGFKIYGQEQVIRGAPHFGDYFISPELYEKLKSCATKPGDILISLVGTAGKVLVLPEGCAPGIINPRLVKLSLNRTGIEPRFVKILLESPQSRAYFKLAAHGGTMEILNLGILKNLPVPLPPLAEQRRIVSEVERCFSVIDELESIGSKDLKRSERLRHSILKCAFEGKLVPQDPSDEPAGALLERIRAERAKLGSDGKLRKSNGRRRVRRASVMEILV